MSARRFFVRLLISMIAFFLMIAAWAMTPLLVVAQCGDYLQPESQIVIPPTPEPVASPAILWYPEPLWLAFGLLLLLSFIMLKRMRSHNKNV